MHIFAEFHVAPHRGTAAEGFRKGFAEEDVLFDRPTQEFTNIRKHLMSQTFGHDIGLLQTTLDLLDERLIVGI